LTDRRFANNHEGQLQRWQDSDISVNCNSNLTEMNHISFTETETEMIVKTETITK